MSTVVAIIVGAILGGVVSKFLFLGAFLNLIPWALAGGIIGWLADSKKFVLINGAAYGFVLSFVFMVAGYNGLRPIITVIPFFVLLGLFGATCGLILAIIGYFARKIFVESK